MFPSYYSVVLCTARVVCSFVPVLVHVLTYVSTTDFLRVGSAMEEVASLLTQT